MHARPAAIVNGAPAGRHVPTATILPIRPDGAGAMEMTDGPASLASAMLSRAEASAERLGHMVETQGDIAVLAWQSMASLATPFGAFDLWATVARRSVEANMVLAEALTGVGASLLKAGIDPFRITGRARGGRSEAA
jgi:hypothetical protein